MLGAFAYIFGLFTFIFLGLIKGLAMTFYLGSPVGTILFLIYIFLKLTEYLLFKFKIQNAYLKISYFNKKAFKVILALLLIFLIKYIMYPKTFNVYVWFFLT